MGTNFFQKKGGSVEQPLAKRMNSHAQIYTIKMSVKGFKTPIGLNGASQIVITCAFEVCIPKTNT